MTIPLENQLNTILTPVFGNEIYPIAHPDPDGTTGSVANKFGVWTIVGGQPFNSLTGDAGISRVRVQVSTYSMDYTEFKTTQRAIDAAMLAANLLANQCVDSHTDQFGVVGALANVSATIAGEGREEDTKRYFSHQEYYVWALQ